MASLDIKLPGSAMEPKAPSADRLVQDFQNRAHTQTAGAVVLTSLWVLGDLLAIWAAALLSLVLRFRLGWLHDSIDYSADVETHFVFLLLYFALIVLFANMYKLYLPYRPCTIKQESAAVMRAISMASLLLAACIYISGIQILSRLVMVSTMFFSMAGIVGWRYCRRSLLRKAKADGVTCRNALLVGTDSVARSVEAYLQQHKELGFVVVGFLAGEEHSGSHPDSPEVPSLGKLEDLPAVCRARFVDEVIVCAQDRETLKHVIDESRRSGVSVRVIPDFYSGVNWASPIEPLGQFPSILLYAKHTRATSLMFKRLLDIAVSSVALILLAPLLALLTLLIKLDTPGPAVYVSRRVGKKGRLFYCCKFRTMVQNADKLKEKLQHLNERDGVLFKISNDPRITRVGRYLRKYSLDELPQFWNVLKGDMSIVGPRPPLANEVEQYQAEFLRRLEVAPGITGLWQVEARRCPSFDRYIELDLQYVEQWSLLMDIKILFKTILVVIAGTGQ